MGLQGSRGIVIVPSRPIYMVPTNLFPTNGTDASPNWLTWLATVPDHSEIRFQPGANYGFGDGFVSATNPGAFPFSNRNDLVVNLNSAHFTALTPGSTHRNYFPCYLCNGIIFTDNSQSRSNLITGPYGTYSPPPSPEQQNPFNFTGSNNCSVLGITAAQSFGYYVATYDQAAGSGNPPPRNITIDSCSFTNNTGQGIAFVCVDGASLTNTTILGCTNSVDIESSFPNEPTRNITIGGIGMGNTFGGNAVSARPSSCCVTAQGYNSATNSQNIVIKYNNMYPSISVNQVIIMSGPNTTFGMPGYIVDHNTIFSPVGQQVATINRCDSYQFTNNVIKGNLGGNGYAAILDTNNNSGTCVVSGNTCDPGQPAGLLYGLQGGGNNSATTGLTTASFTYSNNTNWPGANNVS